MTPENDADDARHAAARHAAARHAAARARFLVVGIYDKMKSNGLSNGNFLAL